MFGKKLTDEELETIDMIIDELEEYRETGDWHILKYISANVEWLGDEWAINPAYRAAQTAAKLVRLYDYSSEDAVNEASLKYKVGCEDVRKQLKSCLKEYLM